MLQPQEPKVVVVLGQLPISRGDVRPACDSYLENILPNLSQHRSPRRCTVAGERPQPIHSRTTIIEFTIVIQIECLKILEQLKYHIPRQLRVFQRDFQLLLSSP